MAKKELTIHLPLFIADNYECVEYKTIDIDNLNVGLLTPGGEKIKYVPIWETPHFLFAQQHSTNIPSSSIVNGYEDYAHYISLHEQGHTTDKFIKIINSIRIDGYDYVEEPILVFKNWKRQWPMNRWDVADGFHRLAVLAALGENQIKVLTLRYKRNLFQRAMDRFHGYYRRIAR